MVSSADAHATNPSQSQSGGASVVGRSVFDALTNGGGLGSLTSITSSDRAAAFVPAPLPSLPIELNTMITSGYEVYQETGDDAARDDEQDQQTAALEEFAGGYTPYLGRLTFVACLGGLQFGIDTGIASGMLVAIHNDLGHPLSAGEQEFVVSATTVGAIVGALSASRLGDWAGRKKVMITAGILFALGSVEQAASQVVRELVLGRFLVGLGVGMASMIVPTYLGECAPPSIRGRVVAINSLLITGGQVVAYTVDAIFYNVPHGWRWMVLAGGVPAIIQLFGLFYLDESPRWLISRGRHVAARHVLQRIYPLASAATITAQVNKIETSLQNRGTDRTSSSSTAATSNGSQQLANESMSTSKGSELKAQLSVLWHERANRKALILACGLQACQQLIGANSILYYSSRLLLMAGFQTNPNVAAIWVAVANFIGTVIAMRLVDRVGRRTLLLRATAAATVALACLAIALGQIRMGDVSDGGGGTIGTPDQSGGGAGAWAYLSLVAMVFFLFFYALGLGIVPWLVQSEIFSGNVRGIGGGLATATNWSFNLLTSATFLDLVRLITPQGSFWLYAIVGIFTWTFAYTQLPELMGVSIDDVQATLEGHSNASARDTAGYAPIRGRDNNDEESQLPR